MEQHFITTKRTARISHINSPSEDIQHILIALHGYGQLSPYFIRHFEAIADENTLILAPEALSRFYVDGNTGRVGASWMTKEEREYEIEDQIAYLNQVAEWAKSNCPKAKVHLLGFSQGCAAAWRWLARGNYTFDSLILWAGTVPDEFPPLLQERIAELPIYVAYASEDMYISESAALAWIKTFQEKVPQVQALRFEGKHTLVKEPLMKIWAEITANYP